MSQFMHTLRFVVGMAMVVGGVALVQPFAAAIGAARRAAETVTAGPAMVTGHGQQPVWPVAAGGSQGELPAGGHAIPDPRIPGPGMPVANMPVANMPVANMPVANMPVANMPVANMPVANMPVGQVPMGQGMASGGGSAAGWPAGWEADRGGSMAMPPSASAPPPPPPVPLPPSGLSFSPATPQLVDTYRSTVEIPPPPLLDAQAPPPLAAGWVAHDVAQPAPNPPPVAAEATASVYVVRDGDDLTGIALRVYGHAGAAQAIWAANRDRLPDPQLLPIGMTLRMPPAWTLPAAHASHASGSGSSSIEPTLGAAGSAAAPRPATGGAAASGQSPWLRPAAAAAPVASRAVHPVETAPRATTPATIRVGVGESLESIAVRFYGDRTAAERIWQANQDQLRNPGLLVPGMELRLP